MQKKLIALAAASAFTLPAMAQSSVIVYGQMDIGVASLPDEEGHDVTRIDSALWTDSYIGVKGTEDLGGGLKAVFQVETTLVNDDATGLAGEGRDTFVGLAGGFGTLIAGYLSTPLNNWLADYDANGSNTFRTNNVNLAGTLETRAANTVAYATPDLGGFQGVAFYSVDETYDVPVNIKNDIYGVGLRYDNDAFSAMYTWHAVHDMVDNHAVGLSYDFGVARITGSYIFNALEDAALEDESGWNLGVAVPVGNGTISVGYGQESDIGGIRDNDAKIASIAYSYDLSKRTSLYAGYRYQKWEGEDNTNEFAVGVVHRF